MLLRVIQYMTSLGWVQQVLWTSNLYFLKRIGFYAMTKYYAEPNINILLTLNLPFDSHARQLSHPLMIMNFVDNIILGSCFLLIDSLSFRKGRGFKEEDVQGQVSERILDVDGQGHGRVFKIEQLSWTSYMYHPQVFDDYFSQFQ